MAQSLWEDIQTGRDLCGRVVDLAVEVSNTALLSSFDAARYIGLDGLNFLYEEFFFTADTACNAVFREIQELLDGEVASQNSSSTIDLDAATGDDTSGTVLYSFLVLNS